MVHFHTNQATIFLEERFLRVACDSRNTVCNRFSIPHSAITVLPYHEDMDIIEYDDSTQFSGKQWDLIKECNPCNDASTIPQNHVFLVDGPRFGEDINKQPTYYMWRTGNRGIVNEGHPHFTNHRLFGDVDLGNFTFQEFIRPPGQQWFFIEDFTYEDVEAVGLRPELCENKRTHKKARGH